MKIFTFSLHCKNSIITVVTYANWKLLVIGVKRLEHAMRIQWALNVHVKEACIGLQCIQNVLESAIRLNSIMQCLSGHKLWESRRDTTDNNRFFLKLNLYYFWRNNGLSEKWAVGAMGCRNNGPSEQWAVGIMGCRNNDLTPFVSPPDLLSGATPILSCFLDFM